MRNIVYFIYLLDIEVKRLHIFYGREEHECRMSVGELVATWKTKK
jgi:hypothetical protein